jgi:hypothetical protein
MHPIRLPLVLAALGTAVASQEGAAHYELTFSSTWSAATHPVQFPGNPHYSPLVGGTHTAAVGFWLPGGLATQGIEDMAELGSTAPLASEVQAAIQAGHADQVLNYGGAGMLSTSPDQLTVSFTAHAAFPLLTLVSMLAPSPDWFVGVHDLELIQNGDWIESLVVTLHAYDAGTDSGTTYTAANANTVPQEPIALVTTASGPFQGASTVVGTFTLQRQSSTLVYGCGVNAPGGIAVAGTAELGQTLQLSLTPPAGEWIAPAVTGLALSTAPAPTFPCGVVLPGFGLVAGMAGEVLLGSIDVLAAGPVWNGGSVVLFLPLPNQPGLAGAQVYVQALVAGARVGLTDAVSLRIGS